MSESSSLGLAIVGCGQIVTHHLAGMMRSPDEEEDKNNEHVQWQVRALVDPSAERRAVLAGLAASYNNAPEPNKRLPKEDDAVPQFASLDDLLQDHATLVRINVIFIAVPHDLHERLALQALQHGGSYNEYHVVLEKPLSITVDSCARLVRASQASSPRRMLLVAEQSPYWPEVIRARQLLQEEGAIGSQIVTAAAYYYESMRDNVTSGSVDAGGSLGWRGELARAGGGIALDGGLHWLRPLREICGGRVARVVGVVRHGLAPALRLEGESVGHALLEMEPPVASSSTSALQPPPDEAGPLIATYSCNMLATAPMAHDTCPYFRITGDQGELVIHGDGLLRRPGAGGLRLYNEDHPEGQEQFSETREGGFFLGFTGLWREISRIVTTRDAEAAHESVVRAADDVRVVLALYRSSKSKQWEDC